MKGLRRALDLIGIAGILLGAGAIALVATTDHEAGKAFALVFVPLVGFSFLGTGLFAWWRRPDNRVGVLMVAFALSWFLSQLWYANAPGVFSVGLVVNALPFAFLVHLLVAYPSGRVETRWERFLVVLAYAATTVVQLALVLALEPNAHDQCDGCPRNVFQVFHGDTAFDVVVYTQVAIGVFGLTGLALTLVRRLRPMTGSLRRVAAPIVAAGSITVIALGISLVADVAPFPDELEGAVDLLGCVGLVSIPFGFLVGLLRSRLSRAGAVSELVARLSETGDRRRWLRGALADALGDPSLELAYWVPSFAGWVDEAGERVELPGPQSGRIATPVEHEGRLVAAIVHDVALEDEDQLIRAAGAAAALTLENERLGVELRARVQELRASRARIVEAADEERRRLERDLHDGAQQRLVSLALNLRLARSTLDRDPDAAARILDESADALAAATDELRELARGIHPAVLTDRGLDAAIAGLRGRTPVPVEVVETPAGRLPPPVESAAYFVVAEALTNVARYADASYAEVRVHRDNGHVEVEVRDDGVGGADPARGSGLRGLSDRVAALDGRLVVTSPTGSGTVVRATIPCG